MKPRKSKGSESSCFRVVICLCLGVMACSLFTPYPAQLIRALRGIPEPAPQTNLAQSGQSGTAPNTPVTEQNTTPNQHTQQVNTPEPPPPAIEPEPPTVPLILPTIPEHSIALPAVNYPPFPPVMPHRVPEGAMTNINELARGLNLKTQINFIPGTLASADRKKAANYQVTLSMNVIQPKASATKEELLKSAPQLDKILPGLDALMSGAKVSPFYTQLYTRKQTELRKNLASLDKLLTRHNFYDTETILEITHPQSKRKALWIQSEMDVVSDGSDGDRLTTMPDKILKSDYYQPSTSYRWEKLTDTPNPLLKPWQDRLKKHRDSLTKAPAANKQAIRNKIDYAERVITELKRYSFLISEYDPFIVIPLGIVNQSNNAFSPRFGDYAVVIANGKLYPAIVGDAGPRFKTGEASLRLARAINQKANPYARPVSDLSVSYLIFPGTAEEKPGPIDYARLTEKCRALMNDLGGLAPGHELYQWKDLLAPKPTSVEKTKEEKLNEALPRQIQNPPLPRVPA